MIHSIQISKLRGILEGSLDGLTPLTVLVGPNSSGKSTVLDAILIGASPVPADALGRAIRHRSKTFNGARWLLWRGGDAGRADVSIRTDGNQPHSRGCSIEWIDDPRSDIDGAMLRLHVDVQIPAARADLRFNPDNSFRVESDTGTDRAIPGVTDVRFVEPWSLGIVKQLSDLYSEAKRQGRIAAVTDAVRSVVTGGRGIEVLTERGVSLVHLDRGDRSLQLGLEGDGIQSLVRLALEMAARPRGIVLLEEPETHQHPATLVTTAKVIVAAVQRDIQVVLATHSLELIDALVAALGDDEGQLAKLSVVSLRLDDGRLISSRLDGPSVASARDNIAMELR